MAGGILMNFMAGCRHSESHVKNSGALEKGRETTDLTDQNGFSRALIRLNPLNPWFLREIELTTRY
jgi:hypothetical protein